MMSLFHWFSECLGLCFCGGHAGVGGGHSPSVSELCGWAGGRVRWAGAGAVGGIRCVGRKLGWVGIMCADNQCKNYHGATQWWLSCIQRQAVSKQFSHWPLNRQSGGDLPTCVYMKSPCAKTSAQRPSRFSLRIAVPDCSPGLQMTVASDACLRPPSKLGPSSSGCSL